MATAGWRFSQNLDSRLRGMRDQMKHPEDAFEDMLEVAADAQAAWFDAEGKGWEQLTPKYSAWKESLSPGRKIMHGPDIPASEPKQKKDGTWTEGRATPHEGGALRDDLTRNSRTNPGHFGVERITATGFIFGTNIDYAEAHNTGAGGLPKRRLIAPMGGTTMRRFERIMLRHIMPTPAPKSAGLSLGQGSALNKGGRNRRRKRRR